MTTPQYSIMIIDDHPIIHDGLKTLLANEPNFKITQSATSASEALHQLKDQQPDLAIVDLSLGDSDGCYLIQKMHSRHPEMLLLVYSMSEERLFAERVANAGASGYVMKTSGPDILRKAINTLLSGETFFSPEALKRIEGKKKAPRRNALLHNLSNREMDIFLLIGQGLDSVSISERLNIRRNTVDTHRINIKNKLDLKSSKETDRYAYQYIQTGRLPTK